MPGTLLVPLILSSLPATAGPMEQKLARLVSQSDVTLVPPVGEPSPALGSFVQLYAPEAGQEPDPRRVGVYEVATSSCSDTLRFKEVTAAEKRNELWMVETGIGLSLGLGMVDIGAGYGRKSIAGLDYEVSKKLILDSGLKELEMCCLKTPEACTDRYISEYWYGPGKLHKMASSGATLKATVKKLEKVGSLDFGTSKGWTVGSSWEQPMYFAYRVQTFKRPSCESYMNTLDEVDGMVLFTGVSTKTSSEQAARRDARDDARRQLVEYLGTEYKIVGDDAFKRAEGVISGIKDSLTCIDDPEATPEGPQYLARVRMYVPSMDLAEASSPTRSGTGESMQKAGGN